MTDSLLSQNGSFHVVIPARYASERLPGKMLAEIAGKPMLQWVYERACESRAKSVLIATDDARIVNAMEKISAPVLLTSPAHPSGTDRLHEVAEQQNWSDETIVVNVQGDEPLLSPALINQVAQNLAAHPDAGLATLSVPIETTEQLFDPNTVKVVTDENGFALYFSRAPIPWQRAGFVCTPEEGASVCLTQPHFVADAADRHIGIYAYRVRFLKQFVCWSVSRLEQLERLEQLRALSHSSKIHVATACAAPASGVDTEEDLQKVRALFEAQLQAQQG